MRCDPIQKKGMPSFSVLALFGVSPNVDSTCRAPLPKSQNPELQARQQGQVRFGHYHPIGRARKSTAVTASSLECFFASVVDVGF